MRAALDFVVRLRESGLLEQTARVTCTLYGSLGATGIGHGTPDAVVAGLRGLAPETVDPDAVRSAWTSWPGGDLLLDDRHPVAFEKGDIAFAQKLGKVIDMVVRQRVSVDTKQARVIARLNRMGRDPLFGKIEVEIAQLPVRKGHISHAPVVAP